MLFAEFEGKDGFNQHFIKIETALEYIQGIVEIEIYDLDQVSLYNLYEDDGTVYKMQILWIDITRMRNVKKENNHG